MELALDDEVVGEVRYFGEGADAEILDVFAAFAALEVERARSAEWGNEGAVSEVVRGIMSGTLSGAEEISAASAELGTDLSRGGGVLMARAHSGSAQDGDWRSRVLDLTVRTLRTVASGSMAAMGEEEEGAVVTIIVPAADEDRLLRVEEALVRELPRSPPASRSRSPAPATSPTRRVSNVPDGRPTWP